MNDDILSAQPGQFGTRASSPAPSRRYGRDTCADPRKGATRQAHARLGAL
jgi:hypothetical protein